MQTSPHESVADLTRKAFFTAYDDLDTARMIGLAAPDATVHFLPPGDGGKGSFWEFGKGVWDSLINCFPDISNTVDSLSTGGDTITASVTILSALTEREVDVLRLIADEHPTHQSAERLFISVPTVETHRYLMQKLSVKSVVGMVKFAMKHGLVA